MLSPNKLQYFLNLFYLFLLSVGLNAQSTVGYRTVAPKAFIRHTVQRGETFESIARLYNVSSEKLSSFNYIEDYDGPVIALYLNIPLTGENFLRSPTASQLNALVPVYHVNGKSEHLVLVSKDSKANNSKHVWSNPALGLKNAQKVFVDGYLKISPSGTWMFKTATAKLIAKQKALNITVAKPPLKSKADTITMASLLPDTMLVSDKLSDTSTSNITSAVDTIIRQMVVKSTTKPGTNVVKGKNKLITRTSNPQKILRFIVLLLVVNLVIVAGIHLHLFLKRKKDKRDRQTGQEVSKVLIQTILSDDAADKIDNDQRYMIPQKGASNVTKQLIIDELLLAKHNFKGVASNNLVALYSELKLDEFSLKKLRHKSPSVITQGIKELATMEQVNRLTDISKLLNHANDDVRIEAQCALVKLAGFDGLRFLDAMEYPLTDWHQIKLIDQLSMYKPVESFELFRWLYSANDTIVTLLLKTIASAKFLNMYQWVAVLLKHPTERVRLEAIKCLKEIANDGTPALLQDAYTSQSIVARILILEVLGEIGGEDQQVFFIHQLASKHDSIKFAAAYAMVNSINAGFDLLDDYCYNKGAPYSQIISHIKAGVQS